MNAQHHNDTGGIPVQALEGDTSVTVVLRDQPTTEQLARERLRQLREEDRRAA